MKTATLRSPIRTTTRTRSRAILPIARRSPLWRDKLQLLLESTGDGIFGIDLEGCCIFLNRAGARMLGYSQQEVLGLNMHDLIHHKHPDGSHYPVDDCPIFRAFWKGLPCRIDSEVLWRADGSSFSAEYSSYPIVEDGVVHGAVVTFVDISERKQAEELLRQAKEELERRVEARTRDLSEALVQLRELSAHSHSVREDERTRIAREIHDELGSLLVALKFDVNWLGSRVSERPELTRKCQSMTRLIETAVENVGRIITDLRPSLLDHQGLFAALEWQVQEFAASTEIACDWRIDVSRGANVPDGALATAVFRIFQEILSNVARHAQASEAKIKIRFNHRELRIDVADNGRGAPHSAFVSARAYGVMGMRERARHFGGDLKIDSTPGAGTHVCLSIGGFEYSVSLQKSSSLSLSGELTRLKKLYDTAWKGVAHWNPEYPVQRGANEWLVFEKWNRADYLSDASEYWYLPVGDGRYYYKVTFSYKTAVQKNNPEEYAKGRAVFERIIDSFQIRPIVQP